MFVLSFYNRVDGVLRAVETDSRLARYLQSYSAGGHGESAAAPFAHSTAAPKKNTGHVAD